MQGQTVIITGAGSGIGLETAVALAAKGAALILIEIDVQRGDEAVVRVASAGLRPRLLLADLSIQADIRRVADEILTSVPQVDVLVNNAGAMFGTRQTTPEGLERTFALNHIAYFLLTHLLLERLIASAPARIVTVASRAHQWAALDFDDLQSTKGYSGQLAYNRSKLANILFTRALARRLQDTRVTANALEPGPGMIRTSFFTSAGYFGPFVDPTTAEEGAATSIYLTCSEEVAGVSGQYFADCRLSVPAAAAQDDAAAERLWSESLRISRDVAACGALRQCPPLPGNN